MSTNKPTDDDVISEDVVEQIIAALHAEAEADDFDEVIAPVTPAEKAAGQVAWDAYKTAFGERDRNSIKE